MENLPNDPFMLLSYVNTKLRDQYSNLDEMCDDLAIDLDDLVKRLGDVGFEYSKENNKFF